MPALAKRIHFRSERTYSYQIVHSYSFKIHILCRSAVETRPRRKRARDDDSCTRERFDDVALARASACDEKHGAERRTVRWRDEKRARGEINITAVLARHASRATFKIAKKGAEDAPRGCLCYRHCALGGALLLLAGVRWFRGARREVSVGARASRRTRFGA